MRWQQGRAAVEAMIARSELEYPSQSRPELTTDEVTRDLPKVEQIIDAAQRVLEEMGPF